MKQLLTGNEAAATAVKLARPQVVAAYPITPQTSIAEKLAEYTASGQLNARYMKVESETAAMAACIGASMAGARAFTATSSQGLALMHELLHWASGARLPIVLVNVNRSMAAPWSLGVEQTDSLSQRDTGWIQLYCETGQEALHSILVAFKLAEAVLLPVMVAMDGFYVSHYTEAVDVPLAEEVDKLLPGRRARFRLDPQRPCTFGGGVNAAVFFDLRKRIQADMEKARHTFIRICGQFAPLFGTRYAPVEVFGAPESDLTIVTSGALAGTVKAYLNQERRGPRVRLVKIRMFRPFPAREVTEALRGAGRVVVLDRNLSPGAGGIFAGEVRASLQGAHSLGRVTSVIGGLGGVDITPEHIGELAEALLEGREPDAARFWVEA
jgi:pyruvate ferredoxin oxidoreductase alpha subunit